MGINSLSVLSNILPGIISECGWVLPEDLQEGEWVRHGEFIGSIDRNVSWWIGEWWGFGQHKYGDRKALVSNPDWNGPAYQTCVNTSNVCRKFESNRRRLSLSFKHHAEVASQGIDRSVILKNSKQYLIDEKVDRYDNDTIFIEVWSDIEKESRGWACKSLMSDYIAMAKLRKGRCLLLPVPQLQYAFLQNGKQWAKDFRSREVANKGWTTIGIPVPESVVWKSIGQALRIAFEPFSQEHADSVKG